MGLMRFDTVMLLAIFSLLSLCTSAVIGNFEISSFEIKSPFQADPESTDNTTVSCK